MIFRNIMPASKTNASSGVTTSAINNKMNEFYNSFFSEGPASSSLSLKSKFPPIEVSESDRFIELKVELPSMTEDDVTISIYRNKLVISGEKKSEMEKDLSSYHVSEITYCKFSRSIALAFDIDASKTHAFFTNGVLTINIEKPEDEKKQMQTIPITKGK